MEKKYSSTEILVCGECKGEGIYKVRGELINYHHQEYGPDVPMLCRTCLGAGMVKVKKDTVVTITPHIPNKWQN